MANILFHHCRYHRNGVGGAGYYHVGLAWKFDGIAYKGIAIVFEAPDLPQLAGCISILDQHGDSWRYEDFRDDLLAFIRSPAGQSLAFVK